MSKSRWLGQSGNLKARKSVSRRESQIMWPPPVPASVEQPNFLIATRVFILFTTANFFRYFYSTTHEFSSSLNFPIFILFFSLFSSRVPLGKLTRNPFTTKKRWFFFLFLPRILFLLRRWKIFRNLFLSSRDEPACFTKLNSRFFWLERKKYKNFWSSPNCFVLYNSFACMTRWLFFFGAVCTPCLSYCCSASNRKKIYTIQTFFVWVFLSRKGRHEKKIRERKCKKSWIVRVC